jgi:hypothetical protein
MPASDPGGIFVDRVRAQRAGKVLDLRLLRARCSRRFSR